MQKLNSIKSIVHASTLFAVAAIVDGENLRPGEAEAVVTSSAREVEARMAATAKQGVAWTIDLSEFNFLHFN